MTEAPTRPIRTVPGRTCGSCSLCCKLMNVPELDKPMGQWCRHCKPGTGCTIHATRPQVCRDFFCGYLQSSTLSQDWLPAKAHFIVTGDPSGIVLYVDPANPDAWKASPFYERIKMWAVEGVPRNRLVTVRVGRRTIAVMPDNDFDLGEMDPGDTIEWEARRGPIGRVYSARKVKAKAAKA
ncbi:MAG: hypothetical protein FJX64_07375 [Alphaproteobacteria bacterium]|nr:hypothetical protein [Alphaproteobacteria bacterium]